MVVTIARSGFSIMASRSYEQAKKNTRNSCTVIAIMRACGGFLLSFSQRYQQWCKRNRVTRYTILDAVRQGYGTLLDMVAAQQPNAYHEITAEKNAAWGSKHLNHVSMTIFTVHTVAQDFDHPTKTKAWLHPDFSLGMDQRDWLS